MAEETLLTAARRVVRFLDIDLCKGGLITTETEIALNALRREMERVALREKIERQRLERVSGDK